MKTRTQMICTVAAALALMAIAPLFAGDLNPPAGPVVPTHKTLTEVEPRMAISASYTPGDADSVFKITQPGSYYLTGNISGVAGKHGIEITASGISLDLNGFDMQGIAGTLDGVIANVASLRNIAVFNGSVRSWGGAGVNLLGAATFSARVTDLVASNNSGDGIRAGNGSTVLNCAAYANTGGGIVANQGCTISSCAAYENGGNGISAGFGSTVSNCSTFTNSGNGISVSAGCTVVHCSARGNTLDGILCASAGNTIIANTCSGNGNGGDGAGIHLTGGDNRVEGNNCTGADRGIDVDNVGNWIVRNICSGNTTNWDVVVNNKCFVVLGVNGGAINGDSGGTSPGSTDPSANFTY